MQFEVWFRCRIDAADFLASRRCTWERTLDSALFLMGGFYTVPRVAKQDSANAGKKSQRNL